MLNNFNIGTRVKVLATFSGVPEGTHGLIVEDYGTGVMIAWDLPDRPIPRDKTPEAIGMMYAADPSCPLRDGFDKESEAHYLEEVPC